MDAQTGPEHFPSRSQLPASALERLEECAFEFGNSYDSYLVMEEPREYFFSSGRRGAVGFRRWGRNMQVVGGLLAAPDDQQELLDELIEFARSRRWRLTFFSLNRSDLKTFRERNFQVSKLGEEPIVMLDETEWKGQAYEWLRRQEKACQKNGVMFREIDLAAEPDKYEQQIAPELEEVSRQHLAETLHAREMTFFVGQFDPHGLGRRRLFVAEREDRIECFVVLNPCSAGSMWAIEVFRKRRDAVRGVIPFAMLQALRQLQKEKIRCASLSLIPWLRSAHWMKGGSYVMTVASYGMWHFGNALYDVRGMYHFKSRFRPHWRETYVASLPDFGWSSILTIGILWGLFRVNPFKLFVHWWRDLRDPGRRSLAEPPFRPERIYRQLRVDEPHPEFAPAAAAVSKSTTRAGADR